MAVSPILGKDIPYDGQQNVVTTIAAFLLALEAAPAQSSQLLSGLKLYWLSTTSIRVGPGVAVIPSGGLVSNSANIDKTGLSLSSSSWYHVYLYDNAGTAAVEVVTTAPAVFFGTCYQKTGDPSRRYLGSIRTDGSGNVYRFLHFGDRMQYQVQVNAAPFRCLSAGNATSRTNVSLASVVPVTARIASLRLAETGGQVASVGNPDDSGAYIFQIDPSGRASPDDFPLDSSQRMTYSVATSAGSFYVDVLGYTFER